MARRQLVDSKTWKAASAAERDALAVVKAAAFGIRPLTDVEAREVRELGGDPERTLPFVMSDEGRDRDGDRIMQRGWDLSHFKSNPVVLWAHKYDEPPLGKCLKAWVSGPDTAEGPKLRGYKQFTRADEHPPSSGQMCGDTAYKLLKGGYLNACSVGFIPTAHEPDAATDDESKGDTAPVSGRGVGYKFNAQQLLESSIVPVPSNPRALHDAKSVGGIDVAPWLAWCERALDEHHGDVGLWVPRKVLEQHRLAALGKRTVYGYAAGDAPSDKGAIPYHKYPLADEGAAWDGPAQVSAADTDGLKAICAWYDSSNPDVKSSYKLPHHLAADGHKTVWKGVAAAMGALMGGRGGVDIPDGDRKAVYEHLAKHYREFEKDPPDYKSAAKYVSKTAVPYARHGLAPIDEDYDEGAERAEAAENEPGRLYWMASVYDAEDQTNPASFQLLHHRAADLLTVWRGVQAAMAKCLDGGVSDLDRPLVYQHLANHYRDFRMEPPELRAYTAAELKAMFPDHARSERAPVMPSGPMTITSPETALAALDAVADYLWAGPALTQEQAARIDGAIDLADAACDVLLEKLGVPDEDEDDDDGDEMRGAGSSTGRVLLVAPDPQPTEEPPYVDAATLREAIRLALSGRGEAKR